MLQWSDQNCVFCINGTESLGELILNYLAKITLPKSVANQLGHAFVPNGIHANGVNVSQRAENGELDPSLLGFAF